jgi:hypothetical protein
VSIKAFIESRQSSSTLMNLSNDLERIIALSLNFINYDVPLLPLNPTAVPWNWMTVLTNSRGYVRKDETVPATKEILMD